MTFSALDSELGELSLLSYSGDVEGLRGRDLSCRDCQAKLVLVNGEFVTPHFRHLVACPFRESEPETEEHLQMKKFFNSFSGSTLEMACCIPNGFCSKRRADVVFLDDKVVVECQHSKISKRELYQRTKDWNSLGFRVLWVFDVAIDDFDKNKLYVKSMFSKSILIFDFFYCFIFDNAKKSLGLFLCKKYFKSVKFFNIFFVKRFFGTHYAFIDEKMTNLYFDKLDSIKGEPDKDFNLYKYLENKKLTDLRF